MPQAFTSEQMEQIRTSLFESACRHAVSPGLKKTSIELLTADAGISKSTFYKFYESKERLFLAVAEHWERMIVTDLEKMLHASKELNNKERTAQAVHATFEKLQTMNIIRFLSVDMPAVIMSILPEQSQNHYRSMSKIIVDTLKKANIKFTVSDEVMGSVIHILYLCVQDAQDDGESFFDAFRELVLSACEKMIS